MVTKRQARAYYKRSKKIEKKLKWAPLAFTRKQVKAFLKQSKKEDKKKFLKSVLEKQEGEEDEEIDAFEVKTQTSVDTNKKGKYKSTFKYTLQGLFENKPGIKALEKIAKNSLIGAFNSGKRTGKKYLQSNLYGRIIDGSLRGFEIRPVRVPKKRVLNRLHGILDIENFGKHWRGETQ